MSYVTLANGYSLASMARDCAEPGLIAIAKQQKVLVRTIAADVRADRSMRWIENGFMD